MVYVPPEVVIKATIRPGSVYYFPEDSFNTIEPHYFIVINREPLTDTLVILVCASSKIDKVKSRRATCPANTLIEITPAQYCGFTVDSIIDCNYVLEKSIDQLVDKLKSRKLMLKIEMDINIVNKLRDGVLSSPTVEKYIKDLLA